MHVLVTGGAGFIGSYVADDLLAAGHAVRVFDCLDAQVHPTGERPDYLHAEVEFVRGDVRDEAAVRRALRGIDAVVHLAAKVGVGQSMYEMPAYVGVNDLGTAVVLQSVRDGGVGRLVVASSMSVYGEGLMRDARGRAVETAERSIADLRRGRWELYDVRGGALLPLPTPESKRPSLSSIYALGKYAQEQMVLIAGRTYGVEATALRFFNVYGPRQALSNPYTGVLAIFASRLLNRQPPLLFEDGRQRRDFVHVTDAAHACRLALETGRGAGRAINVGSGAVVTIEEVASRLIQAMRLDDVRPHVTGKFRAGDIRHCFADLSLARELLGYEPRVAFDDGLRELVCWLAEQQAVDLTDRALGELARHGLVA